MTAENLRTRIPLIILNFLAEAMINMNFEAILQTDAISHLKSFLQLGGVQFKVLDEKIAAGWLINMIDNIAEFIKSDASYTPSVSEVYTIFTKGFSTKYFNTFERKQQMTIGLGKNYSQIFDKTNFRKDLVSKKSYFFKIHTFITKHFLIN